MNSDQFKIPTFRGMVEWPSVWKSSKSQSLCAETDSNGFLTIEKAKEHTLHLALNAAKEDLKALREGRGVPLGDQRVFGVYLDAESATVGIQLLLQSYDGQGRRLQRQLLPNAQEGIYVASDEAVSLVLSIRMQGEGRLLVKALSVDPIPTFNRLEAGLHFLGDNIEATGSTATGLHSEMGNTFGATSTLWGVGPEFEYASRIREAPGTYETLALRSQSIAMRDAFARNATNMQFDYDEIIKVLQVLRGGKLKDGAAVVKLWNARGLLMLARILANQQQMRTDLEHAALIFNCVLKVHGVQRFGRTDNLIFIEVLSALGLWSEAQRTARKIRAFRGQPVQAALFDANCAIGSATPDESEWLRILNGLYAKEGLSPVDLKDASDAKRLDRLHGQDNARQIEGPRVSVIVPSYEGADLIRTTLDSLVQQTWRDLEIIVVDDGSSEGGRVAVKGICDEYEDVQLILLQENLGAYVARNEGLSRATGEYITVHDDDDWSHPQKIEVQMRHLIASPHLRGNMSRHARATDDLMTTRINNNPLVSQANFSSLLVQREVFDKVGPWDNVNRGADAEFRDRLLMDGEGEVAIVGDAPLSFTRTRENALTAGELQRGYVDPARLFYVSAYQRAHNQGEYREYARPVNMLPGMRNVPLGRFDVVFMTDFRFPGGTSTLTVNEVERAASLGMNVGLLHSGSSVNGVRPPIHPRALDAAQLDDVSVLSPRDQFHTDLLLVRHPTVLQYADNMQVNFTTRKCVMVVNHPPVLDGGRGYVYDLETCRDNALRLFGETVELRAESGVTRELAQSVQPDVRLDDELWPGFATISPRSPRESDPSRKPVLGRHTRDSILKWPDQEADLLALYGRTSRVDTRLMGGVSSLSERAQHKLREHAEILDFNELPVPDYLATVDFWVYFHSASLTESFGMSTVEAMLSGAVVILPSYMQKNFGDGALYCTPAEAQQLAYALWQDPEAYRRQSEKGLRVACEFFSEEAFDRRLAANSVRTSE